ETIQYVGRAFWRQRDGKFLHNHSVALGAKVPRLFPARMFLVAHQHFVARLHLKAIRDVAVGLSGIAHEGDLVAIRAEELSKRITELGIWLVTPNGILLRIFLRHLLGLIETVKYRLQHGHRRGTDGPIVEI